MKRKDIKLEMRVVPSGRGFTKYWNLGGPAGTVIEIGQLYIKVKWDNGSESTNMKPVHLSPAKNSSV